MSALGDEFRELFRLITAVIIATTLLRRFGEGDDPGEFHLLCDPIRFLSSTWARSNSATCLSDRRSALFDQLDSIRRILYWKKNRI